MGIHQDWQGGKRRGVKTELNIVPVTFREACEFVNKHHRHHSASVGCKFCIGLKHNSDLIGVAICGRPVSRYLDDGLTCEINRLCVLEEYRNACSMLYGACSRVAKNMGYRRVITYILQSENGASLKASNFVCEGVAGGTHWTGTRNRNQGLPSEMKTRWIREFD